MKIAIGGHAAMIAIASDEKEDSQAVPFGKCRRGRDIWPGKPAKSIVQARPAHSHTRQQHLELLPGPVRDFAGRRGALPPVPQEV